MEDLNLNDNMVDEIIVKSNVGLDKHINDMQEKIAKIAEGINNLNIQLLDVIKDIRKIQNLQR